MFSIPDHNFLHPGSASNNLSIFTPKKLVFKLSEIWSGLFIPHPGSRIQGSKRYRIPDPDPQHCFFPCFMLCTREPCAGSGPATPEARGGGGRVGPAGGWPSGPRRLCSGRKPPGGRAGLHSTQAHTHSLTLQLYLFTSTHRLINMEGSMSRDVHSCTHCLRPRNRQRELQLICPYIVEVQLGLCWIHLSEATVVFIYIHLLVNKYGGRSPNGLYFTWCAQLYLLAETPQPPSSAFGLVYEGAVGHQR